MRRTPLRVRRSLDMTVRWVASGGRTLLILAASVVVGLIAAASLSGLVPSLSYDVAFMGAAGGVAHSLCRWRDLEQSAWNLTDGGRVGVFLAATLLELALVLLLAGSLARATGHDLPATGLWGPLHLSAVALLLVRLPLRPSAAVYGFFALIWVVPALMPALQPMLDVRRWFHPDGFPGWIGAVSSILALILGALALPSRALSSSGTNPA